MHRLLHGLRALAGLLAICPALLFGQSKPWECIGPEGGPVASLAQDPFNPSVLLVASLEDSNNIFRSTDHGETWSYWSSINLSPYELFFSPCIEGLVYAYGPGYGRLNRSSDGGRTWSQWKFLGDHWFAQIVPDPLWGTLHATGAYYNQAGSVAFPRYFKGARDGTAWTVQNLSLSPGYAWVLEVDRGNPQNIYISGWIDSANSSTSKLWRSTDGGGSFWGVNLMFDDWVVGLAADSLRPGRLLAAAAGGVYISTDYGDSWIKSPDSLFRPIGITVVGGVVYVPTYDGVYKSTDGLNYILLPGSEGSVSMRFAQSRARNLCVEPANPHTIFIGNQSGIIKSADGGASWTSCNRGLTLGRITSLRVSPSAPTMLLAAKEMDAVYKTVGPSASDVLWDRLPVFYSCTNIADLLILPTDPNVIFALQGGG